MQNAPLKIKNPVLRKIVDAGRVEGEAKGKAEGEAKGKADAVLTVLEARGLAVTAAIAARVRSCGDLAELDRWVRRAATVARADDLFHP